MSASDNPAEPDVSIRFGIVPEIGLGEPDLDAGVLCRSTSEGFLFGFDDKVRFLVRGGSEIVVDCAAGADPDFVRLMLQGSPFGALLHQRGLLALHGCSASIGGRGIAIVGRSSVGKSSLAIALLKRGHTVFGDDIAVVRSNSDGAVLLPSFREAKLWGDMAEHFDRPDLRPLWPGTKKFSMPLPIAIECESPLITLATLELGESANVEVTSIAGVQRLATLLTHTYRRNFLRAVGGASRNYALCAGIAQTTPMVRIERPRRPALLVDELVTQVERLAGG